MTDSISNVFISLSNSFSRLKLTCTNAKALQALFFQSILYSSVSSSPFFICVFILEHIVHAWQCSEVHLKCFRYSGLLMATISLENNNRNIAHKHTNTHTHTVCPLEGKTFSILSMDNNSNELFLLLLLLIYFGYFFGILGDISPG